MIPDLAFTRQTTQSLIIGAIGRLLVFAALLAWGTAVYYMPNRGFYTELSRRPAAVALPEQSGR